MNQEQRNKGSDSPSYKETLNLLQTNFGMRANATQREPELQRFWNEKGIDLNLGISNSGQSFTLHDGPPYANGKLHMGHALNKILKDIINKYQIMRGRNVHFIPGWDCHGLPIELQVLKTLDRNTRENLTPLKLRTKAADYAKQQVASQMEGFKRWGVWGDWKNPYLTLNKEYEAAQINAFGEMALKGYIYRGLKPVHWSPSSQTALAEAELEYPDGHQSTSIYFSFPVIAIPKRLREEIALRNLELPIDEERLKRTLKLACWTTTPWTLPANMAVSVNSKIDYVLAKQSSDQLLILASELVPQLREKINSDLEIYLTFKGSLLEGVSYENQLMERVGSVLLGGDYINTESGTGLVHTAPGHGLDDFNTGLKNNLPVLCPVDERGLFTSEAGKFQGLNVLKDANQEIVSSLKSFGALLKEELYSHRYPYDWRTKKPTIFRATEQWFASLEGFRKDALDAINEVKWLPLAGRKRIESMVKERGDWCISRQRTWGVPIPVFYKKEGNEILLNVETINHIEALVAKHGSDIWWTLDEKDLLPSSYAEEADLWKKGTDTMDVWFDSGSSWNSVIKNHVHNYPADLYLEGSDQHRGWFQSSLLTSVAVNGCAPYKTVLTHGFALDENGRKMSKSLGNIIDPTVIIEGGSNKKQQPPFGADVLRLWVSSVDYSVDVPIGDNILRQLSDVYRKVRNTSRYLLGNLHDFKPETDAIAIEKLPLLDRWMLFRASQVIEEITNSFDNYDFPKFFQTLQNFCVVDLSSFYLDIAKDRLYVSAPSDFRRRSCQTVLALIVEKLAGIISPVLCHMSEDIWLNIPYKLSDESVFLRGWPVIPNEWKNFSSNERITSLRDLRTEVNRALEECRNNQSIGAALQTGVRIELHQGEIKDSLDWLAKEGDPDVDNFKDWLIVSQLQLGGEPWAEVLITKNSNIGLIEIAKARGKKCERCWHFEMDVGLIEEDKNICGRCADILRRL